jgi:large subunit ribosomal protein L25
MSDTFQVALRELPGTKESRRLRKNGHIPVVLYGHGEQSVSLSVPAEQVEAAIRHHAHVVDLTGAVSETALVKSVQWDTFGQRVLHLDLIRVRKGEKVHANVELELHGEAPGKREGGVVQLLVHAIEIECPVQDLPEVIEVNINDLHLDHSITVKDIKLPANATALADPDMVVVQCVTRGPAFMEEAGPAEAVAEPEIIGRPAKEEEEAE